MEKKQAIEELKSIGEYLNYNLGTDSYIVRCKIYDIRQFLIDYVDSTPPIVKNEGDDKRKILIEYEKTVGCMDLNEVEKEVDTYLSNLK